jgi:hypothetical protein
LRQRRGELREFVTGGGPRNGRIKPALEIGFNLMDAEAPRDSATFTRQRPKANKIKPFSRSIGLLAKAAQPLLYQRLQVVKGGERDWYFTESTDRFVHPSFNDLRTRRF